MLIKPEIAFTYDCRQCEKPVNALAGLFSLHAQRFVCRCNCGKSAMVAALQGNRLIVEYPCSICGQRHRAELALDAVFSGEIAALRCPVTDTAACYAGLPERLRKLDSAESDQEIVAFISRLVGIQPKPEIPIPEDQSVPTHGEILSAASELAKRDGISCHCGSLRFTASADAGELKIICASCGACRSFPVKTRTELAKIRNCGMLIL